MFDRLYIIFVVVTWVIFDTWLVTTMYNLVRPMYGSVVRVHFSKSNRGHITMAFFPIYVEFDVINILSIHCIISIPICMNLDNRSQSSIRYWWVPCRDIVLRIVIVLEIRWVVRRQWRRRRHLRLCLCSDSDQWLRLHHHDRHRCHHRHQWWVVIASLQLLPVSLFYHSHYSYHHDY